MLLNQNGILNIFKTNHRYIAYVSNIDNFSKVHAASFWEMWYQQLFDFAMDLGHQQTPTILVVFSGILLIYYFMQSKSRILYAMMNQKCVTSCYWDIGRRKMILCCCLTAWDSEAGKCDNWKRENIAGIANAVPVALYSRVTVNVEISFSIVRNVISVSRVTSL